MSSAGIWRKASTTAKLLIQAYAARMADLETQHADYRHTAEFRVSLEDLLAQIGELERDSAGLSQTELSARLSAVQRQIGQILARLEPWLAQPGN